MTNLHDSDDDTEYDVPKPFRFDESPPEVDEILKKSMLRSLIVEDRQVWLNECCQSISESCNERVMEEISSCTVIDRDLEIIQLSSGSQDNAKRKTSESKLIET